VRAARVWRSVLGVENTVIESVTLEPDGGGEMVVALVRPTRSRRGRCGRCQRRSPGYDQGAGRRRWRGLDLGTTRVYLEADAPRVACPEHGVTVAAVPWARHGSRFTTGFEDTAAWLACHVALSTLAALQRITWRTVAAIVVRVVAELAGPADRLAGLRRIGIEEISYRKGQRYLLCVVDHDTGRLVWAGTGRNATTLRGFFDLLGEDRSAQLSHVSADGAEWIHDVVGERAPQAVLSPGRLPRRGLGHGRAGRGAPRDVEPAARGGQGRPGQGAQGHPVRAAAQPGQPDGDQRTTIAAIATTNKPLYRAYLLKEQLRMAFETKGVHGRAASTSSIDSGLSVKQAW
jgi:transposase